MREYWELFITFFKIGCVSFGGGYAMLPILQRDIVEKHGWATMEELGDYFALGQCTPGVIAVNTSTIIGYRRRGVFGGIVATLGMVFPSMIIITLISALLKNFADIPLVRDAFAGIRAGVCVLILNAIIKLWKSAIADKTALVIYALVLAVSVFTDVSAVVIVLAAGVLGLAIGAMRRAAAK